MFEDIVERLRSQSWNQLGFYEATAKDAANEIERLREALSRISIPIAFHTPTSHVSREHRAAMFYAKGILDGKMPEYAEKYAVHQSLDTKGKI